MPRKVGTRRQIDDGDLFFNFPADAWGTVFKECLRDLGGVAWVSWAGKGAPPPAPLEGVRIWTPADTGKEPAFATVAASLTEDKEGLEMEQFAEEVIRLQPGTLICDYPKDRDITTIYLYYS